MTLLASKSMTHEAAAVEPSLVALLRGAMSSESFQRAQAVAGETGDNLGAVVTRLGLLPEQALAELFASATGLSIIDARALPDADVVPGLVSPAFLRDNLALPVAASESSVTVAFANPLDGFAVTALEFVLGRPVARVIARPSDLELAFERLFAVTDDAAAADYEADDADVERLKDMSSEAPVIRAVNRMVAAAVTARASDIHVEPGEDRLAVRLRIDGMLIEQEPLPALMRQAFVSRVKIMAGLNIAEKRLPQDGRMRLTVRGHDIDLRVATAPSIHGESVVMRILDRSNLALDFATLGFDAPLIAQLRTLLARPHGILLVTGPTGSGKTTTLYAALAEMNSADRKLLTIEDPIEYRLPGVIQTQVNTAIGLDFSAALRSFLRQDPDVMMVGEIRDIETAQVAVQAALTGHTLLSTLHTNTAASAVARLIDMGVEPFLITSSLNGVLAQRLVRRLCPACREPHLPPPELVASFGKLLDPAVPVYRATGCAACDNSGYRGRVALLELLVIDEAIAQLVLARGEAREINRAAQAAGMRALVADGIVKAQAGLTTLEEVLRVAADG
ncbi:MAG TPA: ATPase, T2SS/T4P/T4SS family [Polymorphobacter sp.]|nr:ATPase, T2SS/T4P/T4SS family [Polymorphobacter sp.]